MRRWTTDWGAARAVTVAAVAAAVLPGGCGTSPERQGIVSLAGEPLAPPPIAPERLATLEADLERAEAAAARDPWSEDAAIWLGRRLAYLHRYEEAIDEFSRGLRRHPHSARLLRHRGHRLITVRRLDEAVADLALAAELTDGAPDEVEPDGAPNRLNIPRATLKTNIWYHLALARYLRGENAEAAAAWSQCLVLCTNDDMRVATMHWLFWSLRRDGRPDEAAALLKPVEPAMDVIENADYHRLLLLYKGELTADEVLAAPDGGVALASAGYGAANWWLAQGDETRGRELLQRIVRETPWPAFGHIGAEADLARDPTINHPAAPATIPETPPEPAPAG